MKKTLRFLGTALLAGFASFTLVTTPACGPGEENPDKEKPVCTDTPANCTCNTAKDCSLAVNGAEGTKMSDWICTVSKTCERICGKAADCGPASEGWICEDALCRKPACGSDAECGTGQQCIAGACKAPIPATEVASCTVVPSGALIRKGATAQFSVITKNAAGETIPFKGNVNWASSVADAVSFGGTTQTVLATGGSAAGATEIRAEVNGKSCEAAGANVFAEAAAGKFRVVVADLLTKQLISGAKAVLSGVTEPVDVVGGVAEFDVDAADTEPKTVSVFHKDYSYTTLVDVTSRDVVVFLKGKTQAATFSGSKKASDFYKLSDLRPTATVRLMLSGGSIPGNLVDIDLDTLIGELVKTQLNFGGTSFEVPLPSGTVIGLGSDLFKSDYSVSVVPGVRSVWGLGGNAQFSAITDALGPVMDGGMENLDIGGILSKLLPLIGKLQAGVMTGLKAEAGQDQPIDLQLNTLLRLRAEAKLPTLPEYTVTTSLGNSKTQRFEAAVVLGGALYSPQGLVPLGLTAGIDSKGAKDGAGKDIGDGIIDPAEAGAAPGKVALRVAPLNGGLETSEYAMLALAASFSGLLNGDDAEKLPLVLSGLVKFPGELRYNNGTANQIDFGDTFLGVPTDPIVDGRFFDIGEQVAGASLHRLDIGDDDGEWSVYFPAGSAPANFTIPSPPTGFDDRLGAGKVLLQSIRLNGATYEDLVGFSGTNLDDFTKKADAFSVREIFPAVN